jgi:hypothetical protein
VEYLLVHDGASHAPAFETLHDIIGGSNVGLSDGPARSEGSQFIEEVDIVIGLGQSSGGGHILFAFGGEYSSGG